jgi:calcium-dependent protein kinase
MRDYYRILDPELGKGAYGEVRKCIFKENIMDKKSSLKQFRAVKIMSRAYMEEKDIIAFHNEVNIMQILNRNQGHPNILKLFHYFEDPKRFLLVTELCQGGELYNLALREKKFESTRAAFILKQLLSAVNYMHKNKIVHRDLKPENILLEEKDDIGAIQTIKLIDFGTAKMF